MLSRRDLLLALAAQPAAAALGARDIETNRLFAKQALYVPHRTFLSEASAADPAQWGQVYGQWLAMTGDAPGAWLAIRRAMGPRPPAPIPDLNGARAEDALEAIARLSRGRRVVTINDDHPTSLTRAFAHAVALRLGAEGFTVFAAETFPAEPDAEFTAFAERRGPVTSGVGYYSSDPVYAEMLRDLRDRGWRFAPYEQRADQERMTGAAGKALTGIEPREEAQAQNLAAYLRAHPQARMLVFCGQGHASKRSTEEALMGERLVRLGFDPLVVDQTQTLPAPEPADDRAAVAAVLARFHPTAPIAVWARDGRPLGPWLSSPGAIDIAVHHPDITQVGGRPSWLARAPARRAAGCALPVGLPRSALVQAAPVAETGAANVIPADQYPLPADGVRRAHFFLRPGAYDVRVESSGGRRTLSQLVV